ncbi:GPI inositol deacylase [Puccinia graminis f. sp. tritici]|uniref:GPI inositol deacylase n=1 Tax=Puccinia graminis f. sp. tritici TaxID=56615 RepID=A0A5B0P0V9_PUCGR|nr:GPI inositol deacylase [Puccinia graminis f. sp. tritici]KAA1094364.1 GPI inositol deacylase [Puccinia graminis f. sp. tritici]
MLTMPNYINQTVNTILSLSSPHSIPPITFESGVERVYDQINCIPGVWSPIDHLAILWCNQLAIVLAKTLLEITEPRKQNQVRSVQGRLAILKSHLILGHGIEPFSGNDDSALSKFHLESLPTNQKAYHQFNPSPVAAPGPDDRADPPQSRATGSTSNHQSNSDEFRNLSSSSVVFTSRSFLSFGLFGAATQILPNQSSLVNEVQLPDLVSSLVAYKLDFRSGSECERGSAFAPLMRQETPLLGESKFHPHLRSAILYTHLSNAYTPSRKMDREEAQKKAGVRLTFWTHPMVCGGSSDRAIDEDGNQNGLIRKCTTSNSVVSDCIRLSSGRLVSAHPGIPVEGTGREQIVYIVWRGAFTAGEDLTGHRRGSTDPIVRPSDDQLYRRPPDWIGFALIDPPRLVGDLLLGVSQASFFLLDWILVLVSLGWLVAVYVLLEILFRVSGLLWIKLVGSAHLSLSRSRKQVRQVAV